MSTIIVAVIVIAAIVSVSYMLVYINNKSNSKKTKALLDHFHQSGAEHNLSFTGQELLKSCIIGLDGIQRKILFLEQKDKGNYAAHILTLDEVIKCTVHQVYRSIQVGDSKSRKEEYLEKVVLQFDCINSAPSFEVPFYKQEHNHFYEIEELKQKAKHWEVILSKLIKRPLEKRA